jgi:hypothetical protein
MVCSPQKTKTRYRAVRVHTEPARRNNRCKQIVLNFFEAGTAGAWHGIGLGNARSSSARAGVLLRRKNDHPSIIIHHHDTWSVRCRTSSGGQTMLLPVMYVCTYCTVHTYLTDPLLHSYVRDCMQCMRKKRRVLESSSSLHIDSKNRKRL